MRRTFCLALLLWVAHIATATETLRLENLAILPTKERVLLFDDILRPENAQRFESRLTEAFVVGPGTHRLWLRLDLANDATVPQSVFLSCNCPLTHFLELYVPQEYGFNRFTSGARVSQSDKAYPHTHPVFPLELPAQSVTTVYLGVQSSTYKLLEFDLMTKAEMDEERNTSFLLKGLLTGSLFALGLYHLSFWVALRIWLPEQRDQRLAYLLMGLFALSTTVNWASLNGLMGYYFFPDGSQLLDVLRLSAIAVAAITGFWTAWLMSGFTEMLQRLRVVNYIFTGLSLIAIVLAVGLLVQPKAAWVRPFIVTLAMFEIVYLTVVAALEARRGKAMGIILLVVWGPTVIGFLALIPAFLLEIGAVTRWTQEIFNSSLFARSILLALALVYRFRVLQQEQNQALTNVVSSLTTSDKNREAFLVRTAHELSVLIREMLSLLESTIHSKQLTDTDRTVLELAKSNGQQLSQMVHNIQAQAEFHRALPPSNPHPFFIEPLVSRCLVTAQLEAEKANRTVYSDPIPLEMQAYADPLRAQQVLLTLLHNAITHGRGSIRISARPTDDKVQISVNDRGISLLGVDLAQLLDPWERDRQQAKKHSGIGLGLSRQLIESLGGTLWGEVTPDDGTTFHFTLPMSPHMPDRET